MRIETQFDLGECVVGIRSESVEHRVPCAFCDAAGRLVGADGTGITCPKCFGRKCKTEWLPQAWRLAGTLTVGRVRVGVTDSPGLEGEEVFDNFKAQAGREEEYMCVETGIGSGSIWKADVLFATRDEALAACDERNAQQVTAVDRAA